jgi:hypothetical protein
MNNPPEPYDREEHSAWLAPLSPDATFVTHTPSGYKLIFIMVALTKRALLTKDIKPAEQLLLLEKMNGLTDQYFTPEMLATIEPMGDTEYEIFKEARSLSPPGDKTCRASFDVLTSPRVFGHFITLNPSILAAIKLRDAVRHGATSTDQDHARSPKASAELLRRVKTAKSAQC